MTASRHQNLGILFLIAANGLTAAVDAVAKYLTSELHSVQIVWGYFVVIFLLFLGYAVARGVSLRRTLRTDRFALQIARPAMLVLTITMLFLGLTYIPLADATAITFMTPLFVTALSVPLLGEQVGPHRWGAVVIGLVGVVIIIRPGAEVIHWAVFMPLISAVFFALFQIMTRLLATTEDIFTILLYTGGGGLFWISLAVSFVWRPMTLTQIGIFVGMGLLGAAAHVCLVRAFAEAQASLLAPFNYIKLIWVTILGYLMFGDFPGPYVIAGSAVIVASGLYVLYREQKQPV